VNDLLSQLNLTVQERRTVMVIFAVVIIVLNYLFVWPRFGEWGAINKQLEEMRRTMTTRNRLILQDANPTNGWRKLVAKYAQKEGGSVPDQPVDPQVQLQNVIMVQARKTGVNVESYSSGSVKTNDEFFEEHSTGITFESQEPPLISFLVNMGNDPAMIRVNKLHLKPADQNRYRLRGDITLTASYSRKAVAAPATAPKPAVAGAKPAASKAKPAAATAKPPPGPKQPGAPAPPAGPMPPRGRKVAPGPGSQPGAGRVPGPPPGTGPARRPVPNSPPATGNGRTAS
jgi:hypothetical protein